MRRDRYETRRPWKPGYSLTRSAFWLSFWFSWGVAVTLLATGLYGGEAQRAQALALAPIYVPSMVLLIAALLGIHRALGAADLRAIVSQQAQEGER